MTGKETKTCFRSYAPWGEENPFAYMGASFCRLQEKIENCPP